MRIILIVVFMSTILFSKVINIQNNHTNLKNFELEYILDKENKYDIHTIKNAPFQKGLSKNSVGISYLNNFWFKIELENSTDSLKELYLNYNYILFVKYLNIYVLKNDQIVTQDIFSVFNKQDHKKLSGNSLITKVDLVAKEKATIYMQVKTTSPLEYNIFISDIKNHTQNAIITYSITILLLSIIMGISIYYLFLFALTPYKEYIYFSLFLFSVVTWSAYAYGVVTQFLQIYGRDAFYFNSALYLIPLFAILFFKTLFIKNSNFKKINILLNILISILLFISIFYSLSVMGISTLGITIMRYAEYINMSILFIFLSIIIYMYKNKVPLTGYFLVGYIIHVIFFILTILLFMGKIPMNIITMHANLIGTFIESIFFSVLLFYKIRELHKTSKETENMLYLQENKLIAMNEVIQNISHQWRQPLSQINSAVLIIDDELYHLKLKNNNIEEKLTEIETMTKYMSNTIDDFKNFYQRSNKKIVFNVKDCINKSISIVEATLRFNQIKLDIKLDESILLRSYKNDLQQAIIIILNNSKDALVSNKIKYAKIEIKSYVKESKIVIRICDNADGIKDEIIDKLFEPYFTTKHKTQGTGLGLYIAKIIVENTMNGSLYVKNEDKKTCFYIELEDNNER